ncbi:MAG: hypothetical protein K2O03_14140 [Lachnospiraceae bacterium]|nr:hypothetical protein [Lachnospiraceae bacterium]
MYGWKANPCMGLPSWMCVVGEREERWKNAKKYRNKKSENLSCRKISHRKKEDLWKKVKRIVK